MKATFTIQRYDPAVDSGSRWQTIQIDLDEGTTVLEALEQIKAEKDGTLTFRRACRSAICGSCAMHINGRAALACKTQVSGELSRFGEVRLQPLATFKVIKDLVVDMEPFWQKVVSIKPWLITDPKKPEPERENLVHKKNMAKLEQVASCILCSICYAECPMEAEDRDYLGPAPLIRAYRFIKDPRDDGAGQRMSIVGDEKGVWRCRTVFNCGERCPKSIDITEMIQELKRRAILRKLGIGRSAGKEEDKWYPSATP
ncbi:MAG: succinate dehydrogenase iron-sulfur subunit [Chloroflexi bacterium]|nr:succinate dehydrogenase iron-sulfur subunit [Chloroflexota bacterium]